MKKVLSIVVCSLLLCTVPLFARNKAGLNKIGGIIGNPIGMSFSHNFTRLDQIDLTVGFMHLGDFYRLFYGHIYTTDLALGYLRTVYEPVLGGVVCPLEIGGGFSIPPYLFQASQYMTFYFDLRWEIFFKSIPKFNLFLDFSPGLGVNFYNPVTPVFFAGRGGIGLRAVLN